METQIQLHYNLYIYLNTPFYPSLWVDQRQSQASSDLVLLRVFMPFLMLMIYAMFRY